ncbi:MAG: hypothetical protein UW69_C0058G0008, partial [Microgenomates group bacterium GW2011_GWA2_44_7]
MLPLLSVPEPVKVTERGTVPSLGLTESPTQLPVTPGPGVGVAVGVGVGVKVGVGVGV